VVFGGELSFASGPHDPGEVRELYGACHSHSGIGSGFAEALQQTRYATGDSEKQ